MTGKSGVVWIGKWPNTDVTVDDVPQVDLLGVVDGQNTEVAVTDVARVCSSGGRRTEPKAVVTVGLVVR